MTTIAVSLNFALGFAYCGVGVMTIIEMKRDWRTFGFSHFGLAFILLALTCGPHHLEHGMHMWHDGTSSELVDVQSVAYGLPFGAIWLLLRIESFLGGRGDRFIAAGARSFAPIALVSIASFVAISAVLLIGVFRRPMEWSFLLAANLVLVVVYVAIALFLTRTQLANHKQLGGWSSSGMCLAAIFWTCSVMHAAFGGLVGAGVYPADSHTMIVDGLSIPAGLYFLWVVRLLFHESIRDWNDGPKSVDMESDRIGTFA